jgi:hypothetical protein
MKKISEILKGRTQKYDLSDKMRELRDALDKISKIKKELSSLKNIDCEDLIEGWNLIDRYYGKATNYGNTTRSKRYEDGEHPVANTSIKIIEK